MSADFKPKFIPWYEDDFQADRVIKRWTPVQRSFCKNLLMESYYNEFRPNLPNDDDRLWMMADADSLEHWQVNRAVVLTKFFEETDNDGNAILWNKRVREEWEKLQGLLEQRKNAGAASARARLLKSAGKKGQPGRVGKTETEQKKNTSDNNRTEQCVQRSSNDRSTNVQAVDVVGVGESSSLSSDKAKQILRDSELIARWTAIAEDAGASVKATARHRDLALAFYREHGHQVSTLAWTCFVRNEDHLVKKTTPEGKTKFEDREWIYQEFIENGHASKWAKIATNFVRWGATEADLVLFIVKNFDFETFAEANITSEELAILNASASSLHWEFNPDKEDELGFRPFVERICAKVGRLSSN